MTTVSMSRARSREEALRYALSIGGSVWVFDNRQNIPESLGILDDHHSTFNLNHRDWSIETDYSEIRFIAKPTDFINFMQMYCGTQFQHVVWYGDFTNLLPEGQRQQCLLWVMSRLKI